MNPELETSKTDGDRWQLRIGNSNASHMGLVCALKCGSILVIRVDILVQVFWKLRFGLDNLGFYIFKIL